MAANVKCSELSNQIQHGSAANCYCVNRNAECTADNFVAFAGSRVGPTSRILAVKAAGTLMNPSGERRDFYYNRLASFGVGCGYAFEYPYGLTKTPPDPKSSYPNNTWNPVTPYKELNTANNLPIKASYLNGTYYFVCGEHITAGSFFTSWSRDGYVGRNGNSTDEGECCLISLNNGHRCAVPSDCKSNYCVANTCCNSACANGTCSTGTCISCNGTCDNSTTSTAATTRTTSQRTPSSLPSSTTTIGSSTTHVTAPEPRNNVRCSEIRQNVQIDVATNCFCVARNAECSEANFKRFASLRMQRTVLSASPGITVPYSGLRMLDGSVLGRGCGYAFQYVNGSWDPVNAYRSSNVISTTRLKGAYSYMQIDSNFSFACGDYYQQSSASSFYTSWGDDNIGVGNGNSTDDGECCVINLNNGHPCVVATDCRSNFCVDGTCCDSDCIAGNCSSGTCMCGDAPCPTMTATVGATESQPLVYLPIAFVIAIIIAATVIVIVIKRRGSMSSEQQDVALQDRRPTIAVVSNVPTMMTLAGSGEESSARSEHDLHRQDDGSMFFTAPSDNQVICLKTYDQHCNYRSRVFSSIECVRIL